MEPFAPPDAVRPSRSASSSYTPLRLCRSVNTQASVAAASASSLDRLQLRRRTYQHTGTCPRHRTSAPPPQMTTKRDLASSLLDIGVLFSSAMFAGGAAYITVVEQPARMELLQTGGLSIGKGRATAMRPMRITSARLSWLALGSIRPVATHMPRPLMATLTRILPLLSSHGLGRPGAGVSWSPPCPFDHSPSSNSTSIWTAP